MQDNFIFSKTEVKVKAIKVLSRENTRLFILLQYSLCIIQGQKQIQGSLKVMR